MIFFTYFILSEFIDEKVTQIGMFDWYNLELKGTVCQLTNNL